MGTTNILDLNNRVDELEKSYPAEQVMMSDGVTSVEEALDELENGLTVRLSISVTLPATTNGRSSAQLDDVIPVGAKVVGYTINEVSTYSDAACINAYFNDRTVRVTMISNLNDVPQITCNLVVGITY